MNEVSRCQPLLGTYVEITLRGALDDRTLIDISRTGFDAIGRVQQRMNFHDRRSELSRVNAQALHRPVTLSAELAEVLGFALQLSEASGGLFDPTRSSHPYRDGGWRHIHLSDNTLRYSEPLAIDLGGIAKGYAVDHAFEQMAQHDHAGELEIIVNAGGDLRMRPWREQTMGVRHPLAPGALLELPMLAAAVATSGGYYGPDGSTIAGNTLVTSAPEQQSVSVFCSTCMAADALTKVIFLDPDNAPLLAHYGARARLLNAHGGIILCN